MKKLMLKIKNLCAKTCVVVGFFLAVRQIRRASKWTTTLIVLIMVLTFLNLVVTSGILVGSIQGAVNAVGSYFLGDVFISTLKQKDYIEQSQYIINTAQKMPEVAAVTARYSEGGFVESDYKKLLKSSELRERVGTSIVGIDPSAEDTVTHLSRLIVEGDYLAPDDYDKVLLGSMLLRKYSSFESVNFPVLGDVGIGDRVLVTVNGVSREVVVKGILKSKVDEIDRRVFFVDTQFRKLIGRSDYNVDEISIRLVPGADPVAVKEALLSGGAGAFGRVQTREDAEPKFIKDLKTTFGTLGNVISSIGLVVMAITMFIVIFINAITRRRYIGILKGIGISSLAIELSYAFQSFFYALIGSAIGLVITYGILLPYFSANPINFPFGDGILVAPVSTTLIRVVILIFTTVVAGFVPARLIVKKNTLDSILGR